MKGSHNSLTFGKPLRWWGWLCSAVWRCQRKDIAGQVAAGCRVFDIRFARRKGAKYDVEKMWAGAHGVVDLAVNPVAAIGEIARLCPGAIVRVTLEKEREETDRKYFQCTCRQLEERFPDVVFFNGRLKPGWEKLYTFSGEEGLEGSLVQHCGSMSGQWWGKVLPGLWARVHRGDCVAGEEDEETAVLRDFV